MTRMGGTIFNTNPFEIFFPSVVICLMFFSSGLGNGRKTREERCRSHVLSRVHAISRTYHCDVDLDHLAEMVRCLYSEVTLLSPFPHHPLWKNGTLCSPHVRSVFHLLRVEYLYNFFRILLPEKLVSSPIYLFIHSFLYMYITMDSWTFIVYFGYNSIPLYFVAQNFPTLVFGSSFSLLLCAFDAPSL